MKTNRFDDLKKIYILKTLSQQKNLSKTARIHKVTASAVSQSIKALEVSMGFPVIVKNGETWNLTEKGGELLQKTETVFSELEKTFGGDSSHELQIGSLSIGTYESLALDLIPAFSSALRKDFPRIKLHFQISRTPELVKKIQSGELCSAIVVKSDDLPESFVTETVFVDRLGIYCSINYNKTRSTNPSEDLYGTISPGSNGYQTYFKKFLKANPEFKPNLVCDSMEVLRELAECNQAIVILPERVAQKSKGKLVKLNEPSKGHNGEHEIMLISSGSCDRQEFDYLARLLKNSKKLF